MAGAKILFGLEKALENFLHTICEDYNLPYEELYDKYFIDSKSFESASDANRPEASHSAIAEKNKPKPKPKPKASASANTANRKPCAGLTTKKTPCKKFAIDGSDFCACHAPKEDDITSAPKPKTTKKKDDDDDDNPPPTPIKKKKKKPTKSKSDFPTHSHGPGEGSDSDSESQSQCKLCTESGDCSKPPSANKKLEYDFEGDVKTRLSAILSQIDEGSHAGGGSGSDTEDDE